MENIQTNASGTAGTTSGRLYKVPTDRVAVIHALFLANIAEDTVLVTVKVNTATLLSAVPVAPHSTLIPEKVVNLKANDEVFVSASTANSLSFFASITERM